MGDLTPVLEIMCNGRPDPRLMTPVLRSCSRYVYHATRILRRWLNRKSQRKAYNWEGYNAVLRHVQWPRVRIRIDLNPFRRAEAC